MSELACRCAELSRTTGDTYGCQDCAFVTIDGVKFDLDLDGLDSIELVDVCPECGEERASNTRCRMCVVHGGICRACEDATGGVCAEHYGGGDWPEMGP
jgi:predicted RNA-binding Zn-ribbon protein involved in translation (DUF1610 family)